MLPFARRTLPAAFRDKRVFEAMERVPRAAFIPSAYRAEARRDCALPIGYGQTISQPFIVAYMSAGLATKPGDRVLEIGTGSGFQAAILAALGLEVYSIEVIPELSERAAEALRLAELDERTHLRVADGWHGWPGQAPFDGVICTAAPARIPPAFVEQLRIGGRLVIPVGPPSDQRLRVLEHHDSGLKEVDTLGVRFVPLVRAVAEG